MQNVVPLTIEQSALASQECLVPHLTAVQSVSLTRTVHYSWHALETNAEIHAQDLAASTHNATSKTIDQCVLATMDLKVIHFRAVHQLKVSETA